MALKKYFNKILLFNILLAGVIVAVLLLIVQWSLNSYTRHGEHITVPDLKGKTLEQAKDILSDSSLEFQIMDSVFDVSKPPLTVVEQNPKAGAGVKRGRKIYVVVNATSAPFTEIPDLIGRSSYKYAKMELESYGFKLAEPVYKPDPHLNSVIGMLANGKPVSKKSKVAKGSIITLILGDGLGSGSVTVPYLIGMRLSDAQFKMQEFSLNLNAIVDEGVVDTAGAVIYKQVPAYGLAQVINLGEYIDVFVARELPEGTVADTSLYNMVDSVKKD